MNGIVTVEAEDARQITCDGFKWRTWKFVCSTSLKANLIAEVPQITSEAGEKRVSFTHRFVLVYY